jgi:hypothetical protein
MSGIPPPIMGSFLLSPRTANYVAALIREGDNFDFYKWLQKVREEQAQAKGRPQTITSGKIASVEIDSPIGTPVCRKASPNWTLLTRRGPIPVGMPLHIASP